jgi:HK97 gp10 family phage protein
VAELTRVVINNREIERLAGSPAIRNELLNAVQPIVAEARLRAPYRTGTGATSIHAEAVLDTGVWEAHISWDRDHYYMSFQEGGTIYLPPRPFLVPSLEEATQ